jgi:hypothetical protein
MEISRRNGYPIDLIRRLIHKYRHPPDRQIEEDPGNAKKYRALVYVKGVSEKISRIMKELHPNIQLCFRNHRNANPFFTRLKDPIDPKENHSIICQIPCLHCLAVYIPNFPSQIIF